MKKSIKSLGIQIISRIIRRVSRQLIRLRMRPLQTRLAQIKHDQIITFYTLRDNFPKIYNNLKQYNITKFTTSYWESLNTGLEKVFLPYPSFSFLRNPIIMSTMFPTVGGKWLEEELNFLEKIIPRDKLKVLLQEDYIGVPLLLNSTYFTSHNSIHHLYHLIRFLDKTHCNLDQINTVVEWGGGYGNMAKIFIRLKYIPSTYIIIDIPLFSCIQWLYLATILGREKVNLLYENKDTIQAKKINLIPICFVDNYEIDADLFISTWGLSESSMCAQNYVASRQWFNSKHILLAYQNSNNSLPYADRIGKIAASNGAIINDIDFLTGNYYAFR